MRELAMLLVLWAMTTAATPNMNLTLPTVGVTVGPTWATNINTALTVVDAHDHSTGYGVQIGTAGINIAATFEINSNHLSEIKSLRMDNNASPLATGSDLRSLYVSGGNLYYNNSSGTQIQITSGSGLNTASIGGFGGDYVGAGASAIYTDATKLYTFRQPDLTNANIQARNGTLSGTLGVAGTLGVTGATTLSSTLGVAGNTTMTGAASVGSTLTVTGNSALNGFLTVAGGSTLQSTLAVTGATTLSSTLGAGASTLASLGVTGAATVGSTLTANGNTALNGFLTVAGGTTLQSTLDVQGAATMVGAIPDATGTRDLGSTSRRWDEVWSGRVYGLEDLRHPSSASEVLARAGRNAVVANGCSNSAGALQGSSNFNVASITKATGRYDFVFDSPIDSSSACTATLSGIGGAGPWSVEMNGPATTHVEFYVYNNAYALADHQICFICVGSPSVMP